MGRRYTVEEWLESPEYRSVSRICTRLGCSGIGERCPGDPGCELVERAVSNGLVDDIVDDYMNRQSERAPC